MTAERPDFRLLFNMNMGFWGVQLGNGLQTANASAIFESLGAEASQLPLFWLGAPLMGLLTQPVVGELSDRTWTRWGRRQPYFLGGAMLGAIALIVMPLSAQLWQAVALYWLLQFALNVSTAPTRPFVGDLLAPHNRTLGYSIQGFCIGLGTIVASSLPWLLEHGFHVEPAPETGVPGTITGAYIAGAVLFLGGTLWTFWTEDESPPQSDAEDEQNDSGILQGLLHAITHMPPIMRQLAGVQALTWVGIFCIYLYLPTAIALNILGAPNRKSPEYAHGVEWAGICIAFYNLVCLGVSFLIPWLSRRWGRVNTHAICLMCGAVGLISLFFVHSRYPILLSMVGIGIAWASILSIPYSLLMDELSEGQSGVYMGLFNVFVTLPQIAMSIAFGKFMKGLLQGNRLWALMMGGGFMGIAALVMLQVSAPSTAREAESPASDRSLATAEK
jgi:maltose/moltooligosaccharide transporter